MLRIKKKIKSIDQSIKYILETDDNCLFECIYMPHEEDGVVMCLSSQIGCVNKCTHCATGKIDYVRDLNDREIADEVSIMLSDNNDSNKVRAVLFMGMGEPFLNFENVIKSITLMKNEFQIDEKNVTISTVGIPHKIKEFSNLNNNIRLAVSIHGVNNEIRDKIIPLNKIFNLELILEAMQYYNSNHDRKILLQYTLIKDLNDGNDDAIKLCELAQKYNCEIRLIPFNASPSIMFCSPDQERIEYFCKTFASKKVNYILSRSRGVDVSGGCGQLYLYGLN